MQPFRSLLRSAAVARPRMLGAQASIFSTRPVLAQAVVSSHRSYHDKDNRPRNVGSLDRKDPSVGSGLVGAPACGDVMKLDIRVDEKTGTITDARFKTFGCGSAIASSSYLTTLVKGKNLDDAAQIRNVDIASELCLPPVKLHCSMLAEDAIKAAVANYKTKQAARPTSNLAGTAQSLPTETSAAI